MEIRLSDLGKKFQREWVFRNVSLSFRQGTSYALLGPNGSGKSTLMLIMTGLLPPSKGEIKYMLDEKSLPDEQFYLHQSIVAPYEELIEEFSLREMLDFHFSFRKPVAGMTAADIMDAMFLSHAKDKYIKQFSSGMKQRLKLGLAFFSETRILFLDEPCSNLDARGIAWYQQEVQKILPERLLIVCSNQPYEYSYVNEQISIEHFK